MKPSPLVFSLLLCAVPPLAAESSSRALSVSSLFHLRSQPQSPPPQVAPQPQTQSQPQAQPPAQAPKPKPKPQLPAQARPQSKILTGKELDAQIRLQVFLDTVLFSPGKIDGQKGEFTDKAILEYQKANGMEQTGKPDLLPIPADQATYTEYTIKQEDTKFVGNLPAKLQSQAQRQYMPYDSLAEFLTERFHCSLGLLEQLNPGVNLSKLAVGSTIKAPAVEPFQIEDVKAVAQLPEVPEFKNRSIHVNRKERQLELLEGETILACLPITPGSPNLPTPPGKWKIYGITTMPTFRWDEGVLNHGVRTDQYVMLPPGPNNPVGVVWCGLNRPGIGIHGTNNPDSIGRAASHGCMRVANWDVIRLVQKVTAGIPVIIE